MGDYAPPLGPAKAGVPVVGQTRSGDQVNDQTLSYNTMTNPRAQLIVNIDGGGTVISSGVKLDVTLEFPGAFTQWTMLCDQQGRINVDVWRVPFAAFPPTATNSICGGAYPSVTDALSNRDSALLGWTKVFAAGDVLRFNVLVGVSLVQRATLVLQFRRT